LLLLPIKALPRHTEATKALLGHTKPTEALLGHTEATKATKALLRHTEAAAEATETTEATKALLRHTKATEALLGHTKPTTKAAEALLLLGHKVKLLPCWLIPTTLLATEAVKATFLTTAVILTDEIISSSHRACISRSVSRHTTYLS
jgi:hypothetical protein